MGPRSRSEVRRRQRSRNKVGHRLRQQHLTAVRDAHDPCGAVHLRAEKSLSRRSTKPAVQSAAAPERESIRRALPRRASAAAPRRADRIQRIDEGRMHAVAGRFHDHAPMVSRRRPGHRIVPCECRRIRSGSRSQSRVLPSMSVNRNVTMPVVACSAIVMCGRARSDPLGEHAGNPRVGCGRKRLETRLGLRGQGEPVDERCRLSRVMPDLPRVSAFSCS